MVQQILQYFSENTDTYLLALREHIWISLITLSMAMIIGIPIGCFCAHAKKWSKLVTALFQVLRIIPSLAILFLLIPVMGTGIKPAMTALTLLAVPPILMNTTVGFGSVPEFMLETARGLGMTKRQIFWKVQVPLSLPLVMTGIKTALVEIIASATLAAYIGGGALGTIIFTGLGLGRSDLLLIGGCSVALLSILAGILLNAADRQLLKYKYMKT